MNEAKVLLPDTVNYIYISNIYEIFEEADAIVMLAEWNEYRGLDLKRARKLIQSYKFLDLRNVYEAAQLEAEGFDLICVGRSGK